MGKVADDDKSTMSFSFKAYWKKYRIHKWRSSKNIYIN